MESMSEEELQLVHKVLLHTKKHRLWREISAETEDERSVRKWERLPEISGSKAMKQQIYG